MIFLYPHVNHWLQCELINSICKHNFLVKHLLVIQMKDESSGHQNFCYVATAFSHHISADGCLSSPSFFYHNWLVCCFLHFQMSLHIFFCRWCNAVLQWSWWKNDWIFTHWRALPVLSLPAYVSSAHDHYLPLIHHAGRRRLIGHNAVLTGGSSPDRLVGPALLKGLQSERERQSTTGVTSAC